MIRPTLILFLKAPIAGRVKSRLAADLGWHRAARLHRTVSARTLRRFSADRRLAKTVAITPAGAAAWAKRLGAAKGWEIVPQVPGDLGRRMAAALKSAAPGPALIVGSDIPDADPARVMRAFRLLRRRDLVLGPATDGGYWLIGISRANRRHLDGLMAGVRWSTPETLGDTVANARRMGVTVGYAETLPDLDTVADLAAVGFSSYGPSSRARAGAA